MCLRCTCCNKEKAELNVIEQDILIKISEVGEKIRFNQLKRNTSYHQEISFRIFKRLILDGYIWKDKDGNYTLCYEISQNRKISKKL